MVDDCIKIERTRENGKTERFGKAKDIIKLQEMNNTKKRFERVKTNAVTTRRTYKEKDSNSEYENSRQLYVDQEYKV